MMRTALYPGTFDPVTSGHLDIIKRAAGVCDKLVIGVLPNSAKHPWFSVDERIELLEKVTKSLSNVYVETFDGLTVDFGRKIGAKVIVRGLRAITDFEYELQIAQINHKLNPEIDTIFFTTSQEYSYVSSSIAKEIALYGGDVNGIVPLEIKDDLFRKVAERMRKN
ncbi:MAG: pantetheine-phosphate adenylyltransferase [Lachnospiraceae bacterium]|nr:pantetheine-phosphate adenylyltransferase [Lachnospiraceae bacterium]